MVIALYYQARQAGFHKYYIMVLSCGVLMAANPDLKQLLVRVRPSVHHRLPGMAARKGYRSVNEYVSTLLEAEMEQDKTQLAAAREAETTPVKKSKPKPKKAKRNDKPQPMPKKSSRPKSSKGASPDAAPKEDGVAAPATPAASTE